MRQNKGNHEGTIIGGVLDNTWSIYRAAKGYRVSVVGTTSGKANYTFAMKDSKIDRHVNIDASKLAEERPELYEAIERFFSNSDPKIADEGDEFGDLARNAGKQLTPMQQWRRALLMIRKHELDQLARQNNPNPCREDAIRMNYYGIFRFKIDDDTLAAAMHYITNHASTLELQTYMAVITDFYGGKYRPKPFANLDVQFNMIAGQKDELCR